VCLQGAQQHFFHLQLGGDAGMVGAGHPERGLALHPGAANHQIFQGDKHDVAHVQFAGDVGRRNGDGKRFGVGRARFRFEPAVFFPPLVGRLSRRSIRAAGRASVQQTGSFFC
jgi:hypothetical protein